MADDLTKDQSDPPTSPLDRLEEYLRQHRLSPRVRIRFENKTGNFVLEDDDGVVHAKGYDQALAVIERTWL